jgi:hypothetical protein
MQDVSWLDQMKEYEWSSQKPLIVETLSRVTAFSGLLLALAIVMYLLGYELIGYSVLGAGVLVAVLTIIKAKGTNIQIKGNTFYYGSSQKVDITKLGSVRIARQLWLEDTLVIKNSEGAVPVSMRGIPQAVRDEIMTALSERVDAS